jgi:exopolysaccharide biosynthesis polyprenyl glycosylphosphotransferase
MDKFKNRTFNIQGLQIIDAFLVWLSFWLSYLVRDSVIDFYNLIVTHKEWWIYKQNLGSIYDISTLLVVVTPFTPLILEGMGYYRHPLRSNWVKALGQVAITVFLMICLIALISLFFKLNASSRAMLVIAGFFVSLLLWIRFVITRLYCLHRSEKLSIKESIVLVGNPDEVERLYASIVKDELMQWRVVGRYDLASGKWDNFQKLLHDKAVERVIFAAKHSEFDKIATAVEMCEVRGIEAWISANFMQTQVARPSFDSIQGNPMLVLRSTPDLSWELIAKGVMDWCGALFAILLTSPIFFIVAIGIKSQSPGPIFYRQERAGRYGKPFTLLKFRTMVVDADKKLEELKQQAGNQMSGPVFKLEHDPRIFPFGQFLRKYSIDEFPQFVNVFLGQMSLVGPRPMAMYELPNIERSEHRRKLSVKPGLTCIWQVSGRNQINSFDEWVKLDLQYIDNWSLWLDIKLILMTIPAVLFAKGAK